MTFNGKPTKSFPIRVSTMEADLEFNIQYDALGRDLFELVCRTIGLREVWYFGLQYKNSKDEQIEFLQMDKKIVKQGIDTNGSTVIHFVIKYYPEVVDEELIQSLTIHLFFLQVKQTILSMEIYCPPEASVLLASYAVQAKMGDYTEELEGVSLLAEELLPGQVTDQFQLTWDMWEDRIRNWWANNKGLSRQEAEMEYLKIAQGLDEYGIHYFPIRNKISSDLWLGVSAFGIYIYEKDNRQTPRTTFVWKEILNISFKHKKLVIKTMDEQEKGQKILIWTQAGVVSQVILDLCIGSHNLFLRRRRPDTLEIQQMKIEAKELKASQDEERKRLEWERKHRETAENERDTLRMEVDQLRSQLDLHSAALARTEDTAELLAEKAKISQEEVYVLAKRASNAEAEIQRIKISAIKTEEEKILMERKAREAELIANRMLEESERRSREVANMKDAIIHSRHHSHHNNHPKMWWEGFGSGGSGGMIGAPSSSNDIRSLSAEIEKERREYAEKSRNLQNQLSDLRNEIECLKVEDAIQQPPYPTQEARYTSLRKSAEGTTKTRIQLLDDL